MEALNENYDGRVNVYIADNKEKKIKGVEGVDKFDYSGTQLFYNDLYEKSMTGVDFEVGGKLPGLNYPVVRGYAGAYYFDTSDVPSLSGPRGRVEVRFPDIFDWDGALFEVGGEVHV